MVLVDEGKVELDAPVVQYLPEFTMEDPRYQDITVRMLMNHASGMPGTAYANNNGYEYFTGSNEQTLEYLARSHLKAAPGETAPYCNDGFNLAEMLVTKVSGLGYIDFITQKVLEPLALDRTGTGIAERDDPDYAAFYPPDTGESAPRRDRLLHRGRGPLLDPRGSGTVRGQLLRRGRRCSRRLPSPR